MANGDLKIKRGLFSRKYSVDFRLKIPLPSQQLPILVDSLLREVLPLLVKNGVATNINGREKGDELLISTLPEHKPIGEELAAIFGESFTEKGGTLLPQRFSLALLTKFREFPTPSDIAFDATWVRDGAIPEWVDPIRIGRAFPIRIKLFRFGFERFYPKGLAIFGTTPVVGETLKIECTERELLLSISSDKIRERSELPIELNGIGSKIENALRATCGSGWQESYRELLSRR